MDYLTGIASVPTYEFPYTGISGDSLPFLNYNPNAISSNMMLPYSMNNISPYTSNAGNNIIVYQIPATVPLDQVLRQLGIDSRSLSQPARYDYRSSTPVSVDFVMPPRRHRRRRIVCHEVTDSETDDGRSHSSRLYRREKTNRSPARIHHLLSDVFKKTGKGLDDSPRPNSTQQPMPNTFPSGSPQDQATIGNVWNRAASVSNQKSNIFSGLFNPTNTGGAVIQPPPGQPMNQEAVHDYTAARDTIARFSNPDAAVANVWSRADNASHQSFPPPQQPPPNTNSIWNQMLGGGPPPPPPQQPPASNMNSFWSKMSGGGLSSPPPPPPQQPPPNTNSIWNQMLGGGPPPPPPQQPSSNMNSFWSKMTGGGPSPPPQQPPPNMNSLWSQMSGGGSPPPPQQPPPNTNSIWNQMLGGGPPPPQYPPNSYPPMGVPPQYPPNSYPPPGGPPQYPPNSYPPPGGPPQYPPNSYPPPGGPQQPSPGASAIAKLFGS